MELTDRIKSICSQRGITLTKLMQNADLSPSLIHRWAQSKNQPKLGTVKKIADVLQVPVSELIPEYAEPSYKAPGTASPVIVSPAGDPEGGVRGLILSEAAFNKLAPLIGSLDPNAIEVPRELIPAACRFGGRLTYL